MVSIKVLESYLLNDENLKLNLKYGIFCSSNIIYVPYICVYIKPHFLNPIFLPSYFLFTINGQSSVVINII